MFEDFDKIREAGRRGEPFIPRAEWPWFNFWVALGAFLLASQVFGPLIAQWLGVER